MPLKKQSLTQPYLISAGIAVLFFCLQLFNVVDFHELDAIDMRLKLRGQQPAHEDIVLVGIDDASLAVVGEWPWPRGIHAVLLDILAKYKPRLVFFDVLFPEASSRPGEDEKLSFAVEKSGNVILPFYFFSEKPFNAIYPINSFRKNAWATGYVNVTPDSDGVVRRFRAFLETGEGRVYHPAVVSMMKLAGDSKKADAWLKSLPLGSHNNLLINYPGSINSLKKISFWEVIEATGSDRDAELEKLFKDRVVIVGDIATGTTDLRTTPFSTTEPGVVIQAAAFHTLLTKKYLRSSPWPVDLVIVVLLSLFITWTTRFCTPRSGLIVAGAVMAVYGIANGLVFYYLRWLFPFFLPLACVLIIYGVTLFLKLVEVRFQGELLNRELQTAARIQENFLPQILPSFEGLDVCFQCKFAKQVGGDLYDWVDLGNDCLAVCLGDVSGKGVPAALYMAKVISEFRRENKSGLTPGQVLESLNRILCREGTAGMFVTLFYAVICTKTKRILYSNAGQDPMVFYSAGKQRAEMLQAAQGTPVGLFEEAVYETAEMDYEPGDLFVVVSDGVKELRNPKQEEFGMERLRIFAEREARGGLASSDIVHHLFETMSGFQKDIPAHDDRTILCVRMI